MVVSITKTKTASILAVAVLVRASREAHKCGGVASARRPTMAGATAATGRPAPSGPCVPARALGSAALTLTKRGWRCDCGYGRNSCLRLGDCAIWLGRCCRRVAAGCRPRGTLALHLINAGMLAERIRLWPAPRGCNCWVLQRRTAPCAWRCCGWTLVGPWRDNYLWLRASRKRKTASMLAVAVVVLAVP